MKNTILLLMAFTLCSFASSTISKRGIVLVHYNAGFNAANNYVDVVKIKDAKIFKEYLKLPLMVTQLLSKTSA